MNSSHGLSEAQLAEVTRIFSRFPKIERVVLFGSRAQGDFKRGADVDLAIHGQETNYSLAAEVKHSLEEETLLPYFFDVVPYSHSPEALRNRIDQHGVVIYEQ